MAIFSTDTQAGGAQQPDWFASNAPPPGQFTGANGAPLPADPYNMGGQEYYRPGSVFGPQNAQAASEQANPQTGLNLYGPRTGSAGGNADPTTAAVLAAFAAKGIQPRDQADVDYWVGKIQQNGMDWFQGRAGQAQGGVGDYSTGGQQPQQGQGGAPQGGNIPSYQAPTPLSIGNFVAPTALDEQNDPGYLARLNLADLGLNKSAAAHGTLLTGGTQKDIGQFNQDYASNEYGNVYNRALQAYQTNANTALGVYGANNTAGQNAYSLNLQGQGQGYNQSLQGFYGNLAANNQGFNQNFSLASLGSQNTNAANQLGFNYAQLNSNNVNNNANQNGSYYTQQGNSNAAGQVGSGNAYGGALSNIGNNFLNSYTSSYQGQNF